MRPAAPLLIALGAALPAGLGAQSGPPRVAALGAEWRQVDLDGGATSIRQLAVPLSVVIPAGRFGFDLGGYYASTRLALGATERTLSHLTDTQIRGSYTLGRDRVVASVVLNLPTGTSRAPAADFPVQGAISSSFLAFPVSSYGNGFSATGGMATAIPAGLWNVGLAGSVRVSGRYTPYVDATGPVSYKPGLEGRLRAGVDRLIGQSRITAGLTWSTFGTDQLRSGAITAGRYQPGPRWIAEAMATVPAGRSRLSFEAWHFQRSPGDSVGQSVPNRERLSSVGATLTTGLRERVSLRLGIDGRLWKQGTTDGALGGGTAGLGFGVGPRLTVSPEVRFETGRLEPSSGRVGLRGFSASVFVRSSW